jgi:hypothetical protein
VSRPDDVPVEMTRSGIDDAAAERLLRGSAAAGHEPLGLLVSQLRSMSSAAPQPSAALAAVLRNGFTPAASAAAPAVPEGSRWGRRVAGLAGMSLAVKVLVGTGVALAAVGTAAGAGMLPDPVRDRVGSVVRTLTPFELDSTNPTPTPTPSTPVHPVPAQPTPPALPTPAPMEAPVRGTAPQELPTAAPATGGPRPVPAPVAPGADRRPASPQAEQRPQQPTEAPARPASPRPSPQSGSPERERPGSAPTAGAAPRSAPPEAPQAPEPVETPDQPESPAVDAPAAGGPRR